MQNETPADTLARARAYADAHDGATDTVPAIELQTVVAIAESLAAENAKLREPWWDDAQETLNAALAVRMGGENG